MSRSRAAGARWFKSLDRSERFELGDAFVLGYFDWRDWFVDKPSREFMAGVESEWRFWETEPCG